MDCTRRGAGGAALLLAIAVLGCGSGSPSTASKSFPKDPYPGLYPRLKGPSREFLVRGADNSVQTFGREGTPEERAQATAVIAAWLRARAARDWKRDCAFFSRAYAHALREDAHGVSGGRVKSCPGALDFFGWNASGNYVDTLSGPIESLRVGEGQHYGTRPTETAYAQYHGDDGNDWIVPLEREHGKWWIATAQPLDRLHLPASVNPPAR